MIRQGFITLLLMLVAGCNENMVQQPRHDDYESASDVRGIAGHPAPAGTVDRQAFAEADATQRPPITLALLERGRQRFTIDCVPCHGADGRGDGIIAERGFPAPPSYLEPRLLAAPSAHFYDVMTNGYGVMYSYADRVSRQDRWAIAAYIRALQLSQTGNPAAQVSHGG